MNAPTVILGDADRSGLETAGTTDDLTAVERFARLQIPNRAVPAGRAARYQALLPATAPKPGQQYAFEVDLDRCSGCKACVTACHSLNGLEAGESWRNVGLLVSGDQGSTPPRTAAVRIPLAGREGRADEPVEPPPPARGLQHITTACHHCEDPACLNGCPVLAYEKDPTTGIVRHLDDQCIGCQYCILKCPYEVPKYSSRLGIVRKCDLCTQRLAVGEAPACAQACPQEAIHITLVWQGQDTPRRAGRFASANSFPPGGPDASITQPTTRFVSERAGWDAWRAADADGLRPAQAHWPLSGMLVFTQLGVGASSGAALSGSDLPLLAWLALFATVLGLAVGTLHLGQPLKAWRGFLGWRRSWLSRELVVFGAAVTAMLAQAVLPGRWTGMVAALLGWGAVLCSAMIYVDTQRPFWTRRITHPKFALTTLILGSGSVLVAATSGGRADWMVISAGCLLSFTTFKLGWEILFAFRHAANRQSPWQATARLHTEVFPGLFLARLLCGALGGGLVPGLVLGGAVADAEWLLALGLVLSTTGELLERHLFFVCESAPRMPGGITA